MSSSYYGGVKRAGDGNEMSDFRSDTVTLPSEEMMDAMARAKLGDDVMGEDPTVKELEETAARVFGKEAALFVPSGTMGNLVSLMAHCDTRGSEAILGHMSHIHLYEGGNIATLASIHPRPIQNCAETGELPLDMIESVVRSDDPHYPRTTLIALENTQNACGGCALTPEYTDAVGALAKTHGLKVHIDGARIMNAAAALDVAPSRLVSAVDSLTFCLSKGLSAPAGSVVVGEKSFIHRALRARKALGGGMRQAGILAAAGIVALRTVVRDDHVRASAMARGLDAIPRVRVKSVRNRTNMVHFRVDGTTAEEATIALASRGVLVAPSVEGTIRAVCHTQIGDWDVDRLESAARDAFA